jgi:hypothetical protein
MLSSQRKRMVVSKPKIYYLHAKFGKSFNLLWLSMVSSDTLKDISSTELSISASSKQIKFTFFVYDTSVTTSTYNLFDLSFKS